MMKGILQIPGIRDVKSIHSTGIRSIPKVQRAPYLELYMLKREKDRLEKELLVLDKRRNTVRRQSSSIDNRIEKIQKELQEEQKSGTYKSISVRPVKTMAINY